MKKAEELKLAFAKKWKYLIVLNDKMFYQFDDELNELLDEYADEQSREEAVDFVDDNGLYLESVLSRDSILRVYDEWKSNQEENGNE